MVCTAFILYFLAASSVFAIRQAVSYLHQKLQRGDQVRICTDSKSTVSCLKEFSDRANQSREVISCFVAMQQLLSTGIKLSLHWIPGHRKIEGNEQLIQQIKWLPVQTCK